MALCGARRRICGCWWRASDGLVSEATSLYRDLTVAHPDVFTPDLAGAPGRLGAKHRALARRIRDRHDAYLAFATTAGVPFDNNAAERKIHMVKIRQNVSGCLRTLTGARHFAAIRSYTATTQKHGINLYAALTRLATGTPWLPQST